MSSRDVLKTAPYDPRFPNVNQSKYCWLSFVTHAVCVKQDGSNCEDFRRKYLSMCPQEWTTKWEEQYEAGAFPVLADQH
eukprot:CAMPEP_0184666066 /NCGR_PEP_ID=MMETSP0308-20130426/59899_1 /TAXON_ID=38269 /ORGANISM="Gloeochaete witrockiana, Strain SAG 46.84" /LENGTH=78 /DNA_ID=CAMNT_0027110457 /DNA_START=25 /DNA_END=261 /DNA_ORIENTATION=-